MRAAARSSSWSTPAAGRSPSTTQYFRATLAARSRTPRGSSTTSTRSSPSRLRSGHPSANRGTSRYYWSTVADTRASGVDCRVVEPVERGGAGDDVKADDASDEPGCNLGGQVPPVEFGEHVESAVAGFVAEPDAVRTVIAVVGLYSEDYIGRRCGQGCDYAGKRSDAGTDSDVAVLPEHLIVPVLVHADGEPGFCAVTGINPGPGAAPVVLLPAASEDRRVRVEALAVAVQGEPPGALIKRCGPG